MDFDLEKDISIFGALISKRPEISPDNLKKDLQKYYLPYVQKLITLKKQKNSDQALIIGVSAIQGAGKTTQGEILEVLLAHFGYTSVSRSIDDHYITHKELCELRKNDPRFIRRGVTHDINLAISDLTNLQNMLHQQTILVSGYDKGAHQGDGDRFRWVEPIPGLIIKARVIQQNLIVNKQLQNVKALTMTEVSYKNHTLELPEKMGSDIPLVEHFLPAELLEFLQSQEQEISISVENNDFVRFSGDTYLSVDKKTLPHGWRVVSKKCDFIFYDGWMLGARKVVDESIFDANLPALETSEAKAFAKDVNNKLSVYEPLWARLEFLTVLYVLNYQKSLEWRDQAEDVLRQQGKGMSHEQIREFVYYFWRSVHPAIHIKNLAYDMEHTNQVVIINDDHTVGEVLTPDQLKEKYPR